MDDWLRQLKAAQARFNKHAGGSVAKHRARSVATRVAIANFEPGRGYRAHYNLACYWTRVREWDKALDELRLALEAGDLEAIAQTDEALTALKRHRRAQWAKLFAPSDRPLAALVPIGANAAKALYDQYGIDGAHELVARSDTGPKRQDIAEELVVSPAAVKEWHDLLEMGTKLDLELATLNLLSAARITSLSDLKSWRDREAELVKVLAQANADGSLVDTAPTSDDVKAWLGS